jgi:HK97 gp10 family phage protein
MATKVGGIELDTAVLDRITAQMRPGAAAIIEKYGMAITGEAASNAPVDTGALKNSITSESGMTGEMTFTVKDGVEYGQFVELGTHKMASQPFLVPALESWADRFIQAFKELFK